jgi:hypothetical protein
MLKATAATTAGAALFAGSASTTETMQINWCGCSQVCVKNESGDDAPGVYLVLRAREVNDSESPGEDWSDVYDGWAFNALAVPEMPFCEDTEDTGDKIIAVTTPSEVRGGPNDDDGEYHCNPNQCASKPLTAYRAFAGIGEAIIPVDDPDDVFRGSNSPDEFDASGKEVTCMTNSFGTDGEDFDGTPIEIVRGRCGSPGKEAPPRGNDENNGNNGDRRSR